jgi:hypothetical protein
MENGVDHNYNDPGDPVGSLFCWWDLLTNKTNYCNQIVIWT